MFPRPKRKLITYSRQRAIRFAPTADDAAAAIDPEPSPSPKRIRLESPLGRSRSASPAAASPGAAQKETPEEDEDNVTVRESAAPTSDAVVGPSSPRQRSAPIFSDDVARDSTPPSSPPLLSPPRERRRPTFSFLKRSRAALSTTETTAATSPLVECKDDGNAPRNVPQPPPQKKKTRLRQMQIDLGGEVNKRCRTCGMEYIPSHAEDAALHKKFHAMHVGGVDLTKRCVERLRAQRVWSGGADGSFVAAVGRADGRAAREQARKVLAVVDAELSAVPIGEKTLWSLESRERRRRRAVGSGSSSTPGPDGALLDEIVVQPTAGRREARTDRFKVYMYIHGQKCIGLCLAERIDEAYAVLASDEDASDGRRAAGAAAATSRGSSISTATAPQPAMLGISRIWTSSSHRQRGVARTLLECVRTSFLYAVPVPKEMVAFSQPTESGGQLARAWFGRESGWLVYAD